MLDRTMPPLTRIASYSVLWAGVSAVLWSRGPRGRRAAAVGLAAIGVTSATANLAMKGLARRRRPTAPVPAARRLPQPSSTSFPSGHTASAAAFSAAVGREAPELAVPLAALAAAVGFSRVYTGAHYPGDVLGGWLLGRVLGAVVVRAADRVVTPVTVAAPGPRRPRRGP